MIVFVRYSNKLVQEENARRLIIQKVEQLAKLKNSLDNLPLVAKSISVYDATEDKFIYGRNEDQVLPIASIAKLATAILVLEDNKINEIEISSEDLKEFGDDSLILGEKWQKKELLSYGLMASSNDAIHALSSSPNFINDLNIYTKNIGLINTSFKNTTGLDISLEKTPGAVSTAREVNLLAVRAWRLYPSIFENVTKTSAVFQSISGTNYETKNTNLALPNLPNVVLSKTGYTSLAGGTLVIIFKNSSEHYLAVTVLGSSREDRFTDMQSIVNTLYNNNYE